jgi:hypothetical protein
MLPLRKDALTGTSNRKRFTTASGPEPRTSFLEAGYQVPVPLRGYSRQSPKSSDSKEMNSPSPRILHPYEEEF